MKVNNLTQSAVFITLTLIILYFSSILPINTLSILTIASCLIPICVIKISLRNAILVYVSSTILSFLILPIKFSIYYGAFFGIYGIIKYLIEKLNSLFLEIILKLISFNLLLTFSYLLIKALLGLNNINISLFTFIILAQFAFLIFDYALTLIISFYLNRIHKHV
ncbi:hypothetical protein [Clostridium weizhouense]|uniref:Uncharacterized protein n=1 Tax=Clostridium weizhouense TaxID=2859781 RepID=A0ABS7AKG4_9CLOT|nr:hypothetical protein [Clostridium weizhouense]MBW6409122.1 hypothetical protein [Clostridium weizhouense]